MKSDLARFALEDCDQPGKSLGRIKNVRKKINALLSRVNVWNMRILLKVDIEDDAIRRNDGEFGQKNRGKRNVTGLAQIKWGCRKDNESTRPQMKIDQLNDAISRVPNLSRKKNKNIFTICIRSIMVVKNLRSHAALQILQHVPVSNFNLVKTQIRTIANRLKTRSIFECLYHDLFNSIFLNGNIRFM